MDIFSACRSFAEIRSTSAMAIISIGSICEPARKQQHRPILRANNQERGSSLEASSQKLPSTKNPPECSGLAGGSCRLVLVLRSSQLPIAKGQGLPFYFFC